MFFAKTEKPDSKLTRLIAIINTIIRSKCIYNNLGHFRVNLKPLYNQNVISKTKLNHECEEYRNSMHTVFFLISLLSNISWFKLEIKLRVYVVI